MKRLVALSALVFVAGNVAKAGDLEGLRSLSGDALGSIQDSLEAITKAPPKPGFNPGHNPGFNPGHNPGYNPGHNPGHNPGWNPPPPQPHHPPQPWNPGPWNPHPVPPPPPPQPWNPHPQPQPWYPPHPGPVPPPPPYYGNTVQFVSGIFDWSNDARRSFDEAVDSLRRNGVRILEQRLDYNSYRFVLETRRYVRVERYDSMTYTWQNDAERAANDLAYSYASRGMVILEKNVRRNSFTLSWFDPR